mgnify:CR=1 FL=1
MKMRFLFFLFVFFLSCHTAFSIEIVPKDILNIEKKREVWGKRIKWKFCPDIVKPKKNVNVTPYYGSREMWKKTVKPYYEYAEKVSHLSDLYITSKCIYCNHFEVNVYQTYDRYGDQRPISRQNISAKNWIEPICNSCQKVIAEKAKIKQAILDKKKHKFKTYIETGKFFIKTQCETLFRNAPHLVMLKISRDPLLNARSFVNRNSFLS